MLRLCLYISGINQKLKAKEDIECTKKISFLTKQRYGVNSSAESNGGLINLSSHRLSESERFVLSHGLNFCIPVKNCNKLNTKAEVEMFYNGLVSSHVPTSNEDLHALKARLADFTHS